MESQADMNSWDGIVDNYLKAENLEGQSGTLFVEDIRLTARQQDDGSIRNQIEVITNVAGQRYVFALNFTNSKVVKSKCKSPSELVGKTIHWEKVRVQNPQTKKVVDGISVKDVTLGEKPKK